MNRAPLIAIVEDDEAVRQSLASLVRSLGYGAAGFATAEAFLETLSDRPPDALLTDLQLPGLSGTALLDEIAARDCHVPAIMMTGFPSDATQRRARARGVLAYLAKPVETAVIAQCLAQVLGRDR